MQKNRIKIWPINKVNEMQLRFKNLVTKKVNVRRKKEAYGREEILVADSLIIIGQLMCKAIKIKRITPTEVWAGYCTVKASAFIWNTVLPPSLRTEIKRKQCCRQNSHR